MHKAGNTLDWIIHKEEQNCIHNLTKLEFLSDHCIIEWTMKKVPSQTVKIERQSRNLKNIDTDLFKIDIKNKLDIMQENVNIEEMYGNYINDITSIIEKHSLYLEENLQRSNTNHGLMKKHWRLRSREGELKKCGKK